DLFARHAEGLEERSMLDGDGIEEINNSLRRVERYWSDQIRYIY
ncbi:MAG: MarR family transcriptional regulator, partial [Paracoccaceae bacterium]|nr:MarR family transcriptional regulator [Paracoccaceae bacterium]